MTQTKGRVNEPVFLQGWFFVLKIASKGQDILGGEDFAWPKILERFPEKVGWVVS